MASEFSFLETILSFPGNILTIGVILVVILVIIGEIK